MTDEHNTGTSPEMQTLAHRVEQAISGGERERAQELCREMLEADPSFSQAHMLMAKAMMPGENYGQILSRLHSHLQPETYVEIGVATGTSLARALPQTRVVAIDPEPRINKRIRSRAKLYPLRSDDFFARYDLFEELGTRSLKMVFIDGLHLFEQVLRDFVNLERFAQADSVFLIHDCFPPTELSAERERSMAYWCGDVWRLIPCLKKYRPDLSIAVIPAMPSGLGLITGLDPSSTLLAENFATIVEETLSTPFQRVEQDRQLLNPVANEWTTIRSCLRA